MFKHQFLLELTTIDIVIRVILSILIGGFIGYERGIHNRPAGFRTHILVCLGATIVSLTQDQLRISTIKFMIDNPDFKGYFSTDLGRIGAQVVSGIGFLGAGTIMKGRGIIEGLTTAASLWATGCIGLGIGWGFYRLSLISGVAILIILVTLKKFEVSVIEKKYNLEVSLTFNSDVSLTQETIKIYEICRELNVKIKEVTRFDTEKKLVLSLVVPKQFQSIELMSKISNDLKTTKMSCK